MPTHRPASTSPTLAGTVPAFQITLDKCSRLTYRHPLSVEIGVASIVVCGPACKAEARARILLRIHGSLAAAFRRALREWQGGTGQAGVMVVLLDRATEGVTAHASVLELIREAVRAAQDRHDAALEDVLIARIRTLNHQQ
jgi:hypothetical protein